MSKLGEFFQISMAGTFWRRYPLGPHEVLCKLEPGCEFFLGHEDVAHQSIRLGGKTQIGESI